MLPEANDSYNQFLGVSLVFYDNHKIGQYLKYQQEQFEKLNNSKELFVELVEFVIADIVKYSSPFDNSKRLEKIMDWITGMKSSVFDLQKSFYKWNYRFKWLSFYFKFFGQYQFPWPVLCYPTFTRFIMRQ